MPAIRRSSVQCTLKSSFGPFLGFEAACHERGSIINLFPNAMDDLFAHDGPLSQWPDSIPMLSDLNDVYEPGESAQAAFDAEHPDFDAFWVAPCPPPVQQLSESRYDDHFNSPIEPPIDVPSFNWTYDTSSPSGSPYPGFASETGFSGNTLSPSISIVSSSPRSDNGVLPVTPSNEYNGAFEFDYGNSLPPDAYPSRSSWSNPSPINLSPSPSPSNLDMYETKSSTSRDNSPVRGHECDKPDKRRFPCLILGCNRRFTSQYTLKVHMEAHKPKPKVTFPCTEGCSERFSRQHDRLRHEVAKHGKICEFLCDECGRFFSTKKTLGNHKCPVAQGSTRWVTT